MSSNNKSSTTPCEDGNLKLCPGHIRFESDQRQNAALLMLTGFCALIQPMAGVATAIGRDGTTANSGIPLSGFIGGLTLVTLGIGAIVTGYNQLVHGMGHKYWTLALIVFTQATYIPYITDMTNVGRLARDEMGLIPAVYEPTAADFRVVGAMGILAIMAYGFALVGSVAFMLFTMYKYQSGAANERNATYYRGRQLFYSSMLFLAGLSQLIFGSYVASNIVDGAGPVDDAPVAVAMYICNIPALSIIVGILQLTNATWSIARSFGYGIFGGKKDLSFQMSIAAGWFIQAVFQIAQVGFETGPVRSQAMAGTTAVAFSLNMMPAFLDYKARTLPTVITYEYYGSEDVYQKSGSNSADLKEEETA